MSEIQKKMLIDKDTGEVISEKMLNINIFDEKDGYLFWKNRQAIKTYPGISLPEGLTDREVACLHKLSQCIWSTTNMLAYRGYENRPKPMDVERIAKETGMPLRNASSFIRKLIDLGVMAKVVVETAHNKETQYYLNPIYFFSGNRLSLNLYLLFRTQLDRYLPEWVREKFAEQAKMFNKLERRKGRKNNVKQQSMGGNRQSHVPPKE
jgi:hypothetical protein